MELHALVAVKRNNPRPPQAGLQRMVRYVVLVMLGSFAVLWFWTIVSGQVGPAGQDMDSPWLAAMRLRSGQGLFDADPATGYGYAPWFAWLWVPLTYLPPRLVFGAWMGGCFAGWYLSLRWSRASLSVALLIGPLTFYSAWVGNIQPIMLAALVAALPQRWGPLAVGAAASLKVVPILFALRWAGRGEWGKVFVAIAAAAVLGAPAFLYDFRRYPFGLSAEISLRAISPAIWGVVAILAVIAAYGLAKGRWGAVASAVAVIAARPALLTYDVGYLLTALGRHADPEPGPRAVPAGHSFPKR